MSCKYRAHTNRGIACSTQPEKFTTQKVLGGRKVEVTECLNHAADSEQRGLPVQIIRN